jgi:serine/threonine-protein kinase
MSPLSDSALRRLRALEDLPDLSGTPYRLIRKIGQGGMGIVYLAEDARLGRHVALKILELPDPGGTLTVRMLREARIIARLEHSSIVPVHDVGKLPDGRVFYAMRLVQGKRLDQFVTPEGSVPDLLRIFQKACQAVAFAHSQGIIHRDLKPENVMVGPFGEVLIMDWGLAKLSVEADQAESRQDASDQSADREADLSLEVTSFDTSLLAVTVHGTVMGTPAYMAPEQALGQVGQIDQRSDVYALGAILYFLLTGHPPPNGRLTSGTQSSPECGHLVTPRVFRPDIRRPLESICLMAMAQDPNKRYRSAEELALDVGYYLDGLPVKAHCETLPEKAVRLVSRNRIAFLLVLAYLVTRILLFFFIRR